MYRYAKTLLFICFFLTLFVFTGCDSSSSNYSDNNACQDRINPKYHISHFEICGNAEKPITNGREKTLTLWVEVDSPFSSFGKVWVDDLYLERSDNIGVNLLSDPSFNFGFNSFSSKWRHLENKMCLAEDTWCENIVEFIKEDVWSTDNNTFYSRPSSAVADMGVLGKGYQTHIFQYPLIKIAGIQSEIEFRAHAFVKIEGDLQVRLGLDFREEDVDENNPRENIRAINGRIIQGETSWTKLHLR